MDDALHERVDALERAVTDGDGDLAALADAAEHAGRLDQVTSDVAQLQEQVAELEAATQALRGYVGNIRSVNRDVERRAETALATAEALEAHIQDSPGEEIPRGSTEPDESRAVDGPACSNATHHQATTHTDGPTTVSGTPAPTSASDNHCPECGHSRQSKTGAPPRRDTADDQQPPRNGSESRNGAGSSDSQDRITGNDGTLLSENPAETGTFQRIRELL